MKQSQNLWLSSYSKESIQRVYSRYRYKISQLHCLKQQFSNPNILKTAENTKNFQLGKFLRLFCSLQKCFFGISTTHIKKLEIANFGKN